MDQQNPLNVVQYEQASECGNTQLALTKYHNDWSIEAMANSHTNTSVPSRRNDRTGQRFGRLTAIAFIPTGKRNATWRYLCTCGNETEREDYLKPDGPHSCGCLIVEKIKNPIDRFHAKYTITETGCWIWNAGRLGRYGGFTIDGKSWGAHRAAWTLLRGPIPEGLGVLHNCPGGDNPLCVNPDHLFLGTQKVNMQDAVAKGRTHRRTHCLKGHPLVPENIVRRAQSKRQCKTCANARARKHALEKRGWEVADRGDGYMAARRCANGCRSRA